MQTAVPVCVMSSVADVNHTNCDVLAMCVYVGGGYCVVHYAMRKSMNVYLLHLCVCVSLQQQHLVALRHGQGRRLISNAPTPQQFQEAGFGKVLVVLTPLAAGAGVVTYAK